MNSAGPDKLARDLAIVVVLPPILGILGAAAYLLIFSSTLSIGSAITVVPSFLFLGVVLGLLAGLMNGAARLALNRALVPLLIRRLIAVLIGWGLMATAILVSFSNHFFYSSWAPVFITLVSIAAALTFGALCLPGVARRR